MLTDDDTVYLESYNHMEMDNYSFCNVTTIARDIMVDDEIKKETLCNLYNIQVYRYIKWILNIVIKGYLQNKESCYFLSFSTCYFHALQDALSQLI